MFRANGDYSNLIGNYLFREIDQRVSAYLDANPNADLIRMGIGDVTQPLVPAVIEAMHRATDEMGKAETFRGYAPAFGYDFLRMAIQKRDYAFRGLSIALDEIFVSDGAKCDVANFQELFGRDVRIAVTDPVYPVYVDSNVMSGRSGKYDPQTSGYGKIVYLPVSAENDFVPELPEESVDCIYLCYPNNPTGSMLTKEQLKKFVDYCNDHGALLLYDSAYEAYITDPSLPRSIYEIEGARTCAVEFRSMSKTAGFTGTRCAYTVVPKDIVCEDEQGNSVRLTELWGRRMATKFNGVPYVTQRAAEAAYTTGYEQIMETVAYYMENARILRTELQKAGYTVYGGENAPYVWIRVPNGDSWAFFDELLNRYQIVATPGAGFGAAGEGYLRMTAFASRENTLRAAARLQGGKA